MTNSPHPPSNVQEMSISRGSLYLPNDIYQRYFNGLSSVILLRQKNDLLIMPVMNAAAGGYLLKLKNAAGDRVINAMDFLREQRLDDADTVSFKVAWDSKRAALVAVDLF